MLGAMRQEEEESGNGREDANSGALEQEKIARREGRTEAFDGDVLEIGREDESGGAVEQERIAIREGRTEAFDGDFLEIVKMPTTIYGGPVPCTIASGSNASTSSAQEYLCDYHHQEPMSIYGSGCVKKETCSARKTRGTCMHELNTLQKLRSREMGLASRGCSVAANAITSAPTTAHSFAREIFDKIHCPQEALDVFRDQKACMSAERNRMLTRLRLDGPAPLGAYIS